MSFDRIISKYNFRQRGTWSAIIGVVLITRLLWQPRSPDALGLIAFRDLGFTLILWLLSLAIIYSLGSRLLNLIRLENISGLERGVFSFALGFGCVAYWLFGLGLLRVLSTTSIIISLVTLSAFLAPDLSELVKKIRALPGNIKYVWKSNSPLTRSVMLFCLAIACISFINAFTPPWGYDGLMYHLVGPKIFLQSGGPFPNPDNWYVNGPFTVEMVFTIGMTFGDDVFPKLIHFTLGLLFTIGTFAVARRWMSIESSWITLAVLMGVPTLPIWASFAYIDLGWSAFELLALGAALIWWNENDLSWLFLSGLLIGFAMGSKYLGLIGFGLIGTFIVIAARRKGWVNLLKTVITYVLPAIAIASPWYLKNLVWFGNPIYPLVFGGPGWSESRLELYNAYLMSYGQGRSVLDFILLPYNIYAHNDRFGAVMNQIDIPGPLFLLVFLYPFIKRNRVTSMMLIFTTVRFAIWSLGSQQTRFLLPTFPMFSMISAYILTQSTSDSVPRRVLSRFPKFLAVGLMSITLFYQVAVMTQIETLGVGIGTESRNSFLSRIVRDYPAMEYITESIPESERVLLLGDGQSYYCHPKCIPDPDHFRWAGEIASLSSDGKLGEWLDTKGASFILLSWEDLDFLLQHDPKGVMKFAVKRIFRLREDGCLQEVFSTEWTALYKVNCEGEVASTSDDHISTEITGVLR